MRFEPFSILSTFRGQLKVGQDNCITLKKV